MIKFENYNDLSRITVVLFTMVVVIMLSGCSSIKIKNTDIAPEISDVQAWKIVWAGDISTDSESIRELEESFKSKYAKKEYYADYLDQLTDNLRGLGYHIVDEDINVAEIRIDITGSKWIEAEYLDGDYNSIQDFRKRHHQADPGQTGGDGSISPIVMTGDDVTAVVIVLTDEFGALLGSVEIDGKKITSEKTAAAIDKAIREK